MAVSANCQPAIRAIDPVRCTGCFGCRNACDNEAVRMVMTPEGFYRPMINDKCIECGKCRKHCPLITDKSAEGNRSAETVLAYAAWSLEEELRLSSSSGGIFTELARVILSQGGTVFGVKWSEGWTLRHEAVTAEEGLHLLRGSKYLPSRVGFAYREAKRVLEKENRPVLFSGVPCQIAALHTFIEHDKLVTVDLVCHGTPSQTVFHCYLTAVAQGRAVQTVSFRDKKNGWSRFDMLITFQDGSEYRCNFREDPFFMGFLGDLFINEACYDCPFCSMPRQGDITLADYWGVPKELKSNAGVSLVLASNAKGDRLLQSLEEKGGVELSLSAFELTLRGNPRLSSGHLEKPREREEFMKKLSAPGKGGFSDLLPYMEAVNPYKQRP